MFHPLRVERIVDETHDARSIVLDVPAALADEFRYRAGQFVTLRVPHDGATLQRCYSLASSPDCDGEHKVTVKRVRGGRVSNWLHESVRAGDVLEVMRPEGRFVLDLGDAPLLLFAGGSGITPVISILKTALATTSRPATLLYANRDERSIIFADELEGLRRQNPDRVRVVHRLDEVHGMLDEKTAHALASEQRGASCWVCGPGPFMALVERAATAAGIAPDKIRIERFTIESKAPAPAPAPIAAAGDVPDFVDVGLGGKTHRVPYTPGKTLLQTARDGGLDAPYSCEEGFCGCCAADLLEGKVRMDADDALSAEEKRKGMILACQSRPLTKRCAFRFVEG
jgi:3-ketosteroid 9alpha-monooxygenase subunit B